MHMQGGPPAQLAQNGLQGREGLPPQWLPTEIRTVSIKDLMSAGVLQDGTGVAGCSKQAELQACLDDPGASCLLVSCRTAPGQVDKVWTVQALMAGPFTA